jgi:hypothetical protein
MVGRKLNMPLGLVGSQELFWLLQVLGGDWQCRKCHKQQLKGSVAIECHVKGGKTFICMPCAKLLLDDVKGRLEMCEQVGPEMYAMMNQL